MTLRIHLFGQPRLWLEATPLKVAAPPKTMPLLAYLLLHRRQMLKRQTVAFALWPDDPESAARANLRRHLHQLQNALPPAPSDRPWLVGDSRFIGWNPQAAFWLDVAEFERLSEQPNRQEEAAAFYTGDLLETIYEDWVFFERERLLNRYFDLLTRLVFQHRERRDYPKAISFARQLLSRDAFREDTLRQFLTLRYESGDRAGALQEYKTFEHRLRAEMGVTPMPETLALHELILRNENLPDLGNFPLAPRGCDSLALPGNTPAWLPFVGRESEMERVTAWWSRAARGHGGLGLVGGEAGVGKSRLARQLALLVESQGGRVLVGRTSPTEARPYQAIVEALQAVLPLLAAQSGDELHLSILSSLFPELKTRQPLPALPSLEADRERLRLFSILAASLEQLAAQRPLLVIIEDLHWAGEATAALVEFLARRAARAPILLVGTYRDEETPRLHPLRQLRRRLQGEVTIEHTALSHLSLAAVDCLLASLPSESLPALPGGQSLAARLYTESEGNPLFIELLLQNWRENGLTEEVPGSLRAVIGRHLERLPATARAFAETAAVLGPAFDAETAREIGGWDEAQVHAALRALLDARLAWETEGRSRFDYTFAHHLIQATLYNEIPPAKRQRRHLRAAEVLAELYPAQLNELAGELATHYDLGGAPGLAAQWYGQAGEQAARLYANAEALRFFGRALEITPVEQAVRRFDLLLAREKIYGLQGARRAQAQEISDLESLLTTLTDAPRRIEVALRHSAFAREMGQTRQAEDSAQLAIDLAHALGDLEAEAQGYLALGWSHCPLDLMSWGIHAEMANFGETKFNQALDLARSAGRLALQAESLLALGRISFSRLEFSAAQQAAETALAISRQINSRRDEMCALNLLGLVHSAQAHPAVEVYFKQVWELGRQIGDLKAQAAVQHNLAVVCYHRAEYLEAKAYIETELEISRDILDQPAQTRALIYLSLIAHQLQDDQAALEYARQAERLTQEHKLDPRPSVFLVLGHALAGLGCLADAAETYHRTLQLPVSQRNTSQLLEARASLANVAMLQGKSSVALEFVEKVLQERDPDVFENTVEPFRVHLICYQVLATHHDPRATAVLDYAYHHLLEQARIYQHDPRLYHSFLEKVPDHYGLVLAWQASQAVPEKN